MYNEKKTYTLHDGVTATTDGTPTSTGLAKSVCVKSVATGETVGGTVNVYGMDTSTGTEYLLNSKTYSAAGVTEQYFRYGDLYSYIMVDIASYTAGTFTVTMTLGS